MLRLCSGLFFVVSLIVVPVVHADIALPSNITVIDDTGFSGSQTATGFDVFSEGVEITNQFSGVGMNVSGGLFVNDTDFVVGGFASNFDPTSGTPVNADIVLTFSDPQNRLGFYSLVDEAAITPLLAFTVYRNGMLVGSGILNNSGGDASDPPFHAFELAGGFDEVQFLASQTSNVRFGLAGVQFEATPIPEPSSCLLFAMGGIVLFANRKRFIRSKQVAPVEAVI